MFQRGKKNHPTYFCALHFDPAHRRIGRIFADPIEIPGFHWRTIDLKQHPDFRILLSIWNYLLLTAESCYLQFLGEGPVEWEVSPNVGRRNLSLSQREFWYSMIFILSTISVDSIVSSSSLLPLPSSSSFLLIFYFSFVCFFYSKNSPKPSVPRWFVPGYSLLIGVSELQFLLWVQNFPKYLSKSNWPLPMPVHR